MTSDGGETWTSQEGVGARTFSFVSPTTGWIVGSVGAQMGTFRTTNGGTSWERQQGLVDVIGFADANNGWVTGDMIGLYNYSMLQTSDGGLTWPLERNLGNPCCSDIEVVSATTVCLVNWTSTHSYLGEGKQVTHDGGVTWQGSPVTSNATALYAVDFSDADHGWAVGHGGSIIHTDDGGLTWSVQQVALYNHSNPYANSDEPALHDVHFIDASVGWAVGDGGTILKTTTGGK